MMPNPNPQFFQFEADFLDSMRCIPMVVRFKLDTCGVKLKLQHWLSFTAEERHELAAMPCDTPPTIAHYREHLQALVVNYTGMPASELTIAPHPPWHNAQEIPATVQEKLHASQIPLTLEQWGHLTPLQRFVLIKLSRPSHENHNFEPALREFQLI